MEQKQRPDETGKRERKPISVEEANSRAYQIGLQSDCIIKLEKRAGENRYQRHFKASSASALLNGMAVLIRDYAETLNLSVVEVLSVLAVVLTMPDNPGKKQRIGGPVIWSSSFSRSRSSGGRPAWSAWSGGRERPGKVFSPPCCRPRGGSPVRRAGGHRVGGCRDERGGAGSPSRWC